MRSVEVCCCGNVLRIGARIPIRTSPCRCQKPGPGPTTRAAGWLPDDVPRHQFEERRRVGLPVLTDVERAAYGRKWG